MEDLLDQFGGHDAAGRTGGDLHTIASGLRAGQLVGAGAVLLGGLVAALLPHRPAKEMATATA
ncbi:hypothetical protein [Streptantibioticus ferralitis]|uniref:MFS transporter n=1 Tax=Streptantibioticus ferralitis TaxID=236510 RepID=A0ABT5YWR6_9ACTN|nr:hypothetical protein [Streptantibioticus ferralitis]MDF2256026.1 hypothetical protein [Streptantibioticus ferralitis]